MKIGVSKANRVAYVAKCYLRVILSVQQDKDNVFYVDIWFMALRKITLYHDKYDILMPPHMSQMNYNDKYDKLYIIVINWKYHNISEIISSQS